MLSTSGDAYTLPAKEEQTFMELNILQASEVQVGARKTGSVELKGLDVGDLSECVREDGGGCGASGGMLWNDERCVIASAQTPHADAMGGCGLIRSRCLSTALRLSGISVFLAARIRARGPGDHEHPGESSSTAVQKGDNLMEGGTLEVSVKDGRTNNGGKIEHDKLRRYNDLCGREFLAECQ